MLCLKNIVTYFNIELYRKISKFAHVVVEIFNNWDNVLMFVICDLCKH